MAGIPMHHRDCVANDKVFQFLDQYLILRSQPDKVYYISGERRGKEQWYLILVDITNANSKMVKKYPRCGCRDEADRLPTKKFIAGNAVRCTSKADVQDGKS